MEGKKSNVSIFGLSVLQDILGLTGFARPVKLYSISYVT